MARPVRSLELIWLTSEPYGVDMAQPVRFLELIWLARELHAADMARHTPRSRYGTASTLPGADMADQRTLWSRYGTASTLPGADMGGQGTPWSRYGTTHTPYSRYGMASKLPGTDFLDKPPVVHVVAVFLACYGTFSVTNKPHAKARKNKRYLIDRALHFTCLITRKDARNGVYS